MQDWMHGGMRKGAYPQSVLGWDYDTATMGVLVLKNIVGSSARLYNSWSVGVS